MDAPWFEDLEEADALMTLSVAAGKALTIADHFEAFLLDEVNLNKSRIDTLVKRVETIQTFVGKSDWAPKIIRFSPQGSWAHKTIIKPPGDEYKSIGCAAGVPVQTVTHVPTFVPTCSTAVQWRLTIVACCTV
jgi:hypothetical protein